MKKNGHKIIARSSRRSEITVKKQRRKNIESRKSEIKGQLIILIESVRLIVKKKIKQNKIIIIIDNWQRRHECRCCQWQFHWKMIWFKLSNAIDLTISLWIFLFSAFSTHEYTYLYICRGITYNKAIIWRLFGTNRKNYNQWYTDTKWERKRNANKIQNKWKREIERRRYVPSLFSSSNNWMNTEHRTLNSYQNEIVYEANDLIELKSQ